VVVAGLFGGGPLSARMVRSCCTSIRCTAKFDAYREGALSVLANNRHLAAWFKHDSSRVSARLAHLVAVLIRAGT
jgi:hypothetical protein